MSEEEKEEQHARYYLQKKHWMKENKKSKQDLGKL